MLVAAMAEAACPASLAEVESARLVRPRHPAFVRATHWIAAFCFFALLLSGVEILISHPRFYWGETGNVLTPPLFTLPIPASRASVPTGYNFVLKDQNGWSRSLHFQSAWLLVFTGLFYGIAGLVTNHFRRNLLPAAGARSRRELIRSIGDHLRFARPAPSEAWSYNILQRLAYTAVVFGLVPLMIWTGLAMSPGFVAGFPFVVTVLGGQQSARTIHFIATVLLVGFLVVHVVMVWRAGFVSRMRAMITGKPDSQQPRSQEEAG